MFVRGSYFLIFGLVLSLASSTKVDNSQQYNQELKSLQERLDKLEKLVQIQQRGPSVYFAAKRSASHAVSGHDITFDSTLINLGDGFKTGSGIFITPASGSYRFIISAYGGKHDYIDVLVNGEIVVQFHHDPESGHLPSEAAHAFQLNLKRDDILYLFLNDGEIICDETHPLTFIGELIAEFQ